MVMWVLWIPLKFARRCLVIYLNLLLFSFSCFLFSSFFLFLFYSPFSSTKLHSVFEPLLPTPFLHSRRSLAISCLFLFPLYLTPLQTHPSVLCVAFLFSAFHPLKLLQFVLFCVGIRWLCIVDCLQSWFLEFWTRISYHSVTIKLSILMLGFEDTVLLFATEY